MKGKDWKESEEEEVYLRKWQKRSNMYEYVQLRNENKKEKQIK